MNRRTFITAAATVPALGAVNTRPIPKYRIVTKYKPADQPGMPGPYPGRVVTVHSPHCIDETTEKVDVPTVQTMIARGMTALTGDKDARDSWARFFNAQDFVGIKINCFFIINFCTVKACLSSFIPEPTPFAIKFIGFHILGIMR